MNSEAIRNRLRHGRSPSVRRRRTISALACVGLVDFAVISLFQTGAISRLPDLPGRVFDSGRVNSSRKAYAAGAPDGALGALQYALLLVLASAGGERDTGRPYLLDVMLTAVATGGVVAALSHLHDMARNQQRICTYCLLGALLNFMVAPLAALELVKTRSRS